MTSKRPRHKRTATPGNRPSDPDIRRHLFILNGIPGSGKSRTVARISSSLDDSWSVLHADDFTGVTCALNRPRPWIEIQHRRPKIVGWSAGWYLSRRQNVLVEGYFAHREDIRHLLQGVEELYKGKYELRVVILDGSVEQIARKLVANPNREPQVTGPNRARTLLEWTLGSKIDFGPADVVVDIRRKREKRIAAEVSAAFGLKRGVT